MSENLILIRKEKAILEGVWNISFFDLKASMKEQEPMVIDSRFLPFMEKGILRYQLESRKPDGKKAKVEFHLNIEMKTLIEISCIQSSMNAAFIARLSNDKIGVGLFAWEEWENALIRHFEKDYEIRRKETGIL